MCVCVCVCVWGGGGPPASNHDRFIESFLFFWGAEGGGKTIGWGRGRVQKVGAAPFGVLSHCVLVWL